MLDHAFRSRVDRRQERLVNAPADAAAGTTGIFRGRSIAATPFGLSYHRRHDIKIRLAGDVRRLLVPRPLHLLTLHPVAEQRPSPKKQFVVVCTGVGALGDPPETVQIQLTLKARQLALPKVSSHNF